MNIINSRPALLLSKQHITPYIIEYAGFNIIVDRDVFPPELSSSSLPLFDILANYKANISLDMGVGTGILSLKLSCISKNVIASDNHWPAIENTKKNILSNNINNVEVIHSDLFDNFPSWLIFDLIVFNHPYYPSKNHINFGIDGSGGYFLINKFFEYSKKHISQNGRIIMPFSDFAGDENNPCLIAHKHGFSYLELWNFTDNLGRHKIFEFVAS